VKRSLPILAGISILLIGAWWVYPRLVSDTTRIEWMVDGMAAGFNASSASRAVAGLAEDFVEEKNQVGRSEIKAFLFQLFFTERDPDSKDFLYRVSLDRPNIQVEPSGDRAHVSLEARFERRAGKDWKNAWKAKIEADLVERDGEWTITRARHETTSGRRPF
jgi:hypothetical protein